MEIKHVKISEVIPYRKNPRLNDKAVESVAKSISEFGFRQPIVVNEEMVVVVGHTRLKAAQKLGLETVPVHVAIGLSEDQQRAYRIADNKTGEFAEWDISLLKTELDSIEDEKFKELTFITEDDLAANGYGVFGELEEENKSIDLRFPIEIAACEDDWELFQEARSRCKSKSDVGVVKELIRAYLGK